MRAAPGLLEPPSDDELFSLAGFLVERPCGRPALGLEQLHGFLTALHCVPGPLPPRAWLPVVFGGDVERARGRTGSAMVAVAMRMSNEIARSLFDTTNQEHYAPLVAFPGTCEQVSARSWCDGFLVGLDLKSRAWVEHIEEDAGMRRVLCPIIALSTRFGAVLESAGRSLEDDADEEELEEMLPSAVLAAYNWWRIGSARGSLSEPNAMASATT
ncbi:MAG: YecA family protein [Actinobacteria bacterium]|nr:YecA family protein [Actinomycetota bacterium]